MVEVTTESWFERIKNAFFGVIIGMIMFVLSFVLLWMNEKWSVQETAAINVLDKDATQISATSIDPATNNKPVVASGMVETKDVLKDDYANFEVNTVRLRRKVEMYQYRENVETEEKKNTGGSKTTIKTYTYPKEWSETFHDTKDFNQAEAQAAGAQNPPEMKYRSDTKNASKVEFGAFVFPNELIGSYGNFKKYDLSEVTQDQLLEEMREQAKVSKDQIYLGESTGSPAIGDYRISYEVAGPDKATIVGLQKDSTIVGYQATDYRKFFDLRMGEKSKAEVVADYHSANTMFTWLLRLGGFVMMGVGISLVLRPLAVIGDVIPFIGTMLEYGTGIVAFSVAFALSLVTISIAWFAHRPLLSVLLIAGGVGVFFAVKKMLPSKKSASDDGFSEVDQFGTA